MTLRMFTTTTTTTTRALAGAVAGVALLGFGVPTERGWTHGNRLSAGGPRAGGGPGGSPRCAAPPTAGPGRPRPGPP